MAGRPCDRLRPRRNVRLRAPLFDHEARHGGPDQAAAEQVEPAGQARVEPRAIRISRPRDVDDFPGTDCGHVDLSLLRQDRAPLPAARHHDDVDPLEQVRGPLPPQEPEGAPHLHLVPEEHLRAGEESPERRRGVHVVNLLRWIESDSLSKLRSERGDFHIILRAPRREVYDLGGFDGVLEELVLCDGFHRSLVHDRDLIPAAVREDPRHRSGDARHDAEVRQVHPIRLERLPVLRREVLPDEAREGGADSEAGGDASDVPASSPKEPLPVEDLDGGVWRGQGLEVRDVVQDHVPIHAEEIHRHVAISSLISTNPSKGVYAISSDSHSSARRRFAKTRSASMAGHRSESPSPMYTTWNPAARSSKTRSSLHVPHRVHEGSANGYSIRIRPPSNTARLVRTGTSRSHDFINACR